MVSRQTGVLKMFFGFDVAKVAKSNRSWHIIAPF